MSEECAPHPASGFDPEQEFLRRIDLRMERQNRRLEITLTAWAEILDALGWHVALWLPGRDPVLSTRAREWATTQSETPLAWEEITTRLAAEPPVRQLIQSDRVRVWAMTEAGRPDSENPGGFEALTKREAEVLGWLREGKTGPEIAIILGCARRTVETHVARIYRKIGVRDRAQLYFQSGAAAR